MAEKFYITTAIDYVNGPPHIGHAIQKVWADVIARYRRLQGREVWFLTGTDEHGATNVRAAEKMGITPKELADENSAKFRALKEALRLSWDDFIRTSDQERHWPGAVLLWRKIAESGDFYKKNYRGLYCVGHEAFVTEKDLIDGKCADHGKEPEILEEENYFFKLSKYEKQIRNAIESDELLVFPQNRKNEILSFLKEGLEDVSFSRPSKDISWGISVPGDASQTMYVWCDALVNYISAIGYGRSDEWQKWWPADMHVLGKDNLRFHAAIWPGMLLSAGLPLPKMIFVHEFITVEGRKMSKTIGNIVDPLDLVGRYGTDAVRYYFTKELSPFQDGNFTEGRFWEAYNSSLANGLGNYVSRVAKMIERYFEGAISKPSDAEISKVPAKKHAAFFSFKDESSKLEILTPTYFIDRMVWPEYKRLMQHYELKSAMDLIWTLLGELDEYVQTYEPFKLVKTDQERTKAVLWNLAYGALSVAWMLKPFMPDTSEKILNAFGVGSDSGGGWKEVRVKLDKPLFARKENAD